MKARGLAVTMEQIPNVTRPITIDRRTMGTQI
jgi:hypothetical protein